ncbi:peptidoglycan-binding domain-containing protein [Nocardia sp. IFM 10818]
MLPSTEDGNRRCIPSVVESQSRGSAPAAPLAGVTALHEALRLCYGHETADGTGIYGPATKTDVRYVQDVVGEKQDGVYGPRTAAAMKWPVYDNTGEHVACVRTGPCERPVPERLRPATLLVTPGVPG